MDSKTDVDQQGIELPNRCAKHAVWLGLLVTIAGVLSYFMYFFQFPALRDFPVVNLPLALAGLALVGSGCWQMFKRRGSLLVKLLSGVSLLLSLGLTSLFVFYVFFLSYQMPAAAQAPPVKSAAPDFTLADHQGQPVTLADFEGKHVILVFYRGYW